MTYAQEIRNENVVTSIDASLDLIKRAMQDTSDEQLKQQLRQQWNGLCEILKRAQQIVKETSENCVEA